MPVCQHVCVRLGVRLLCGPGVSVCECAYRECFGIPALPTSSLIGLQRLAGLADRLTSWSCLWPRTLLTSTTLGATVTWFSPSPQSQVIPLSSLRMSHAKKQQGHYHFSNCTSLCICLLIYLLISQPIMVEESVKTQAVWTNTSLSAPLHVWLHCGIFKMV